MKHISVREMKSEDISQLSVVYEGFWGEASDTLKMRERFLEIQNDSSYTILVAMDAGRMAGSVMGIVVKELYGEAKPYLLVENVAVHKDYRRMGVGKLLLDEIEKFGRDKGCKSMLLMTEPERTGAHAFYLASGFSPHSSFKKILHWS